MKSLGWALPPTAFVLMVLIVLFSGFPYPLAHALTSPAAIRPGHVGGARGLFFQPTILVLTDQPGTGVEKTFLATGKALTDPASQDVGIDYKVAVPKSQANGQAFRSPAVNHHLPSTGANNATVPFRCLNAFRNCFHRSNLREKGLMVSLIDPAQGGVSSFRTRQDEYDSAQSSEQKAWCLSSGVNSKPHHLHSRL